MSELYHHGVKGQKWGIRRRRMPNLDPKGPFKNFRRKQAARKTARIYSDMITKNIDFGSKLENFRYKRNTRKIAESYADMMYYTDTINIGEVMLQQTLKRMGIDEHE